MTQEGVQRVGTLNLELEGCPEQSSDVPQTTINDYIRREITVHMKFGDTEVKASAVDHITGKCVKTNIDFMAL